MKREILCENCNKELSGIKPEDLCITVEDIESEGGRFCLPVPLPEEIIKKYGKGRRHLYCDVCGDIIEQGVQCVARSSVGYGQSYRPWEAEYIST